MPRDPRTQKPNRKPRKGSSGETAAQRRQRMRKDVVLERERRALELYVQGKTYKQIGEKLSVATQTAWTYVKRGLARRADEDGEIATRARSLMQMQMEAAMGVWLPRMLGLQPVEDDPGRCYPPDPRAADVMDKIWRQYGPITGALMPIKVEGNLTVGPANPEEAVNMIMEGLARMAQKERTIDGHLADAGHTQHELTTGERGDALPPPFQQDKAA